MEEPGVREHVAETVAHLRRTGASFAEEFDTPAEHVARLTPAPVGPFEDVDRITVYVDVFELLHTMNQLGADGWELIGRGSTGHQTHRHRHDPHAWEYRSVRAKDAEQARALTEMGWEPVLELLTRTVCKRPVAAVTGTQGRVSDPPPPAHTVRFRWGYR